MEWTEAFSVDLRDKGRLLFRLALVERWNGQNCLALILGTKGVSFQACSGRTVERTEAFSVTINCVSQGPEAVMPLQLVEGKLQAAVFAALLHAVWALLFVLGQCTHCCLNIAVFMRASSYLQHQGKMVREVPINICYTIHMQIQI